MVQVLFMRGDTHHLPALLQDKHMVAETNRCCNLSMPAQVMPAGLGECAPGYCHTQSWRPGILDCSRIRRHMQSCCKVFDQPSHCTTAISTCWHPLKSSHVIADAQHCCCQLPAHHTCLLCDPNVIRFLKPLTSNSGSASLPHKSHKLGLWAMPAAARQISCCKTAKQLLASIKVALCRKECVRTANDI